MKSVLLISQQTVCSKRSGLKIFYELKGSIRSNIISFEIHKKPYTNIKTVAKITIERNQSCETYWGNQGILVSNESGISYPRILFLLQHWNKKDEFCLSLRTHVFCVAKQN